MLLEVYSYTGKKVKTPVNINIDKAVIAFYEAKIRGRNKEFSLD